jgi:putative endonuclease
MSRALPARDSQTPERRARLRRGHIAELVAALVLMCKGYRILGRRQRTVHGEIDLIASRRRRIAFVEVKRRRTLADCEAALTPRQAERIARAADHWIARHPRYGQHEIGLDAILIARGRLPRHLPNALDSA